jgi:DNA-binding LytR/AlgR family response regulator
MIIDDGSSAPALEHHICKVPFLKLTKTYHNPMDALFNLNAAPVDLIFLDIPKQQLNAVQFLKLLENRAQVIITSDHEENAAVGFEHDVTDYLPKPISFERFFKGVEKVRKIKKLTERVDNAQETQPLTGGYIFVKFETKIIRVELDDILFIEGLKNYVSIYTKTQRIVTLQVMKQLEKVLPPNRFVRIHRSYIVALDKIDSIERQEIYIDDHILPIGVTYQDVFFKLLESRWP